MKRISLSIAAISVGIALAYLIAGPRDQVDFNRDIRPILNDQCVTCHGGVRRKAGLSLLFRQDALEPAESGRPAIVPGEPGRSDLIRRLGHPDDDERMPLHAPPLADQQVALLKKWIAQGAKWEPHWAYVPPRPQALPAVEGLDWPANGIDLYVLARLEEAGLSPSPRAGCSELIRRVSLDLVGLPPSPEQAKVFCDETDSYGRVVDSLLASPRFGERWAALWLDLARFADSNGYEADRPRVIWKFRDWVIRALNQDMPFDQFTIEQLAGDLLPDATEDQRIATAFHRNTMTNQEGGTDDEEFRVAAVIDRVNTTFEVWQGTTIACVQCHGHPYDPFRHDEYYRLFAFFNNTADADRSDDEPKLYDFSEDRRADGEQLVEAIRQARPKIDSTEWKTWTDSLEAYAADGSRPAKFEDRLVSPQLLRIAKRTERSPNEIAQLREFFVATRDQALQQRRGQLRKQLRELDPITTPVMQELPPDEERLTYVFERGNWMVRGERVEANVPHALPPLPDDAPRNRLSLARWLVDAENPLTARVTVNRFWEQLFGLGIVETVEDLGTQGAPPTHPELLDWLALRFQNEHGWSIKSLLREIVTSATYRQSSRVTPELLQHDPRNLLLARGPRFRLSAEQIRDQALAVSGLLSDKMYGPSVFPPQPDSLWKNPYSDLEWKTSEGEDRYRRAVYTFWRRTVPHPAMLAFDSMSREVCTSRRIRTNTPLQALVTLNDPAYFEAAVALAERMQMDGGSSVDSRIRHGFRQALLVDPTSEILHSLRNLYDSALAGFRTGASSSEALLSISNYHPERGRAEGVSYVRALDGGELAGAEAAQSAELAALAVVANAIMNLDSFLAKE